MDGSLPTTAPSAAAASAETATWTSRWWVRLALAGGAVLALAAGIAVWAGMGGGSGRPAAAAAKVAPAVREPLIVSITESGEVDAKRSTVVRCEVEGESTVVWVIEEGTLVQKGDELVRLDSANLEERLRSQEMTYKTAKAAFEKAEKAYLIAQSTRESLLAEAGLAVKFALLDLRKYLGADLADAVIGAGGEAGFEDLVNDERLGGEALQQKLKLQSDIDLAEEELKRADSTVEWTRKLESRGYVTGMELEADELKAKRMDVALGQARTALDLFLRYEFPKMAEQYYTDWLEAGRERDRVDARTQSDVDTAETDLENKREALRLEETNLEKVREQLAATTITAPQPGMVVFDTGRGRRRDDEPLEAGSTVRHQQELIKLPDLSEMNVEVRLHESVVKQVDTGDRALVRIDALPEARLMGSVTKIAVMPDRTNWWLNPGLKTYTTEVTLDETPEGLKPGMSAQVEILIDRRDDVLQVPISAVHIEKGFQVVYVDGPSGIETRRVTVGLSNQRRAEIVEGLKAGERVYLYRPTNAPALDVPEGAAPAHGTTSEDWNAAAPAGKGGADRPDKPAEAAERKRGMPDLKNLTPEQMKQMREHLKNLPEDQRKRILRQLQKARQDGESAPERKGPGNRTGSDGRGGGRGRRNSSNAGRSP
ncbi:MAG: efflux RND transporter periplasmic adaptor subunit [Phycisphaerae bacterium]